MLDFVKTLFASTDAELRSYWDKHKAYVYVFVAGLVLGFVLG